MKVTALQLKPRFGAVYAFSKEASWQLVDVYRRTNSLRREQDKNPFANQFLYAATNDDAFLRGSYQLAKHEDIQDGVVAFTNSLGKKDYAVYVENAAMSPRLQKEKTDHQAEVERRQAQVAIETEAERIVISRAQEEDRIIRVKPLTPQEFASVLGVPVEPT